MTTMTMTQDAHRQRLEELRAEVTERLATMADDYETLAEAGTDVGSGDDEGGSESDQTFVERDRLRAHMAEDELLVGRIDDSLARAAGPDWQTCATCGGPIGDARLEALPTTEVCVTCKANAGNL